MPSTSGNLSKIVQNASGASPLPRKHRKKLRQDAAVPVTLTDQPTACTDRRKTAPPRRRQTVSSESDDEDPVSLLASFQQGRAGYKVQADHRKHQLTQSLKPSSQLARPPSQPPTDQDIIDTSSSEVPHSKRADHPSKLTGGRHPEPGSRCDTCIIQRRGCDGVRPVCGRCTLLGRECEWHDEAISRKELEEMRRKGPIIRAMRKPTKRSHDEMSVNDAIESRGPTATSPSEEEVITGRDRLARREDQIASLKAREDALKPVTQRPDPVVDQGDHPTILDAAALEQGINQWTYEDHLEMLERIFQPRVDPITMEEAFGYEKGNRIFGDTTKALEDFDDLDDLDEIVPRMQTYNGLKLNWEESEPTYNVLKLNWEKSEDRRGIPTAALSHGAGIPSGLRRRIGLPEYPVPSVEVVDVPQVQESTSNANPTLQYEQHKRLTNAGRDDFGWMDDWMQEPRRHAEDWDDGGRLPRPDKAANFSWYDDMFD